MDFPTANLGYDLSLSFLITLIAHVEGVRRRGVKEYLRAFVTPGFMTPMNIFRRVHQFCFLWRFGSTEIFFAGEVLAGLLLALSQNALYWYPFAFIANMLWTAFSISFHVFRLMYLPCRHLCTLVKKINEGEE